MKTSFHSQLANEIEQYFSRVSDAELSQDIANANFDFYNRIGEPVMYSKLLGTLDLLFHTPERVDLEQSNTSGRALDLIDVPLPLAA